MLQKAPAAGGVGRGGGGRAKSTRTAYKLKCPLGTTSLSHSLSLVIDLCLCRAINGPPLPFLLLVHRLPEFKEDKTVPVSSLPRDAVVVWISHCWMGTPARPDDSANSKAKALYEGLQVCLSSFRPVSRAVVFGCGGVCVGCKHACC